MKIEDNCFILNFSTDICVYSFKLLWWLINISSFFFFCLMQILSYCVYLYVLTFVKKVLINWVFCSNVERRSFSSCVKADFLSRLLLRCRRGWILWVLAPTLWTSRLSSRGRSSWTKMARPPRRTRASARASRLRSPSDQTSTLKSSSCESSHQRWIILII